MYLWIIVAEGFEGHFLLVFTKFRTTNCQSLLRFAVKVYNWRFFAATDDVMEQIVLQCVRCRSPSFGQSLLEITLCLLGIDITLHKNDKITPMCNKQMSRNLGLAEVLWVRNLKGHSFPRACTAFMKAFFGWIYDSGELWPPRGREGPAAGLGRNRESAIWHNPISRRRGGR